MSLCFDITALCVSLIMLFTYYIRRNIFMKSGYYYSIYLGLLILFSIAEIFLDLHTEALLVLTTRTWYITRILGIFLAYFLTYIILRYFLAVMSVRRLGKALGIVIVIYIVIMTSLIVTTPFTELLLGFENGEVVRGPLYLVPYYVVLFTFAIILIAAFLFRDKLSKSGMIVVIVSVMILCFAGAWQVFFTEKLGIKLFAYCYMIVGMLLYPEAS